MQNLSKSRSTSYLFTISQSVSDDWIVPISHIRDFPLKIHVPPGLSQILNSKVPFLLKQSLFRCKTVLKAHTRIVVELLIVLMMLFDLLQFNGENMTLWIDMNAVLRP